MQGSETMTDHSNVSSAPDDTYVSLDISRDSDEDKFYVMTKKVQSRARKQIGEFGKSVVDLEMMPISSNQAKELSDALMGEQDEKVYSKDSIVGLPNPAQLVRSLKLQLRKRENTVLNFGISTEFHLFWPLIIKAEIHPLFTALEGILSWIVLMSYVRSLFWGLSIAMTAISGVAIFACLNLIHFWYGFARYRGFVASREWWGSDVLNGRAATHHFEQIRDVCSSFCNGDDRRRNQTCAVVLTLPFTAPYHILATILAGVGWIVGLFTTPRQSSGLPLIQKQRHDTDDHTSNVSTSATTVAILLVNLLLSAGWVIGTPLYMSIAALTLFFSQHFYSSLLFRRSFGAFALSIVFGNFLAVQDRVEIEAEQQKRGIDTSLVEENSLCESAKKEGDEPTAEPVTSQSPDDILESISRSKSSATSLESLFNSTDSGTEAEGPIQTFSEEEIVRPNGAIDIISVTSQNTTVTPSDFKENKNMDIGDNANNNSEIDTKAEGDGGEGNADGATPATGVATGAAIAVAVAATATATAVVATPAMSRSNKTINNINSSRNVDRNEQANANVNANAIMKSNTSMGINTNESKETASRSEAEDYSDEDTSEILELIHEGHLSSERSSVPINPVDENVVDSAVTSDTKRMRRESSHSVTNIVAAVLNRERSRGRTSTAAEEEIAVSGERSWGKIPKVLSNSFKKQKISETEHRVHTNGATSDDPSGLAMTTIDNNVSHLEVFFDHDDNHGLRVVQRTIKEAVRQFLAEKYSPRIHFWALDRLQTSSYFVPTPFGTFRRANKLEVWKRFKRLYKKELEKLRQVETLMEEIGRQQLADGESLPVEPEDPTPEPSSHSETKRDSRRGRVFRLSLFNKKAKKERSEDQVSTGYSTDDAAEGGIPREASVSDLEPRSRSSTEDDSDRPWAKRSKSFVSLRSLFNRKKRTRSDSMGDEDALDSSSVLPDVVFNEEQAQEKNEEQDQAQYRDDAESSPALRSKAGPDEKGNAEDEQPAVTSSSPKSSKNFLLTMGGWCETNDGDSTVAQARGGEVGAEPDNGPVGDVARPDSRQGQENATCVPGIGDWCFTGRDNMGTEDETEIREKAENASRDTNTVSSDSTASPGGNNAMTKKMSRSITPKAGNLPNDPNGSTTNTTKNRMGSGAGSRLPPEMESTGRQSTAYTMTSDTWVFGNSAFPSLSLSTTATEAKSDFESESNASATSDVSAVSYQDQRKASKTVNKSNIKKRPPMVQTGDRGNVSERPVAGTENSDKATPSAKDNEPQGRDGFDMSTNAEGEASAYGARTTAATTVTASVIVTKEATRNSEGGEVHAKEQSLPFVRNILANESLQSGKDTEGKIFDSKSVDGRDKKQPEVAKSRAESDGKSATRMEGALTLSSLADDIENRGSNMIGEEDVAEERQVDIQDNGTKDNRTESLAPWGVIDCWTHRGTVSSEEAIGEEDNEKVGIGASAIEPSKLGLERPTSQTSTTDDDPVESPAFCSLTEYWNGSERTLERSSAEDSTSAGSTTNDTTDTSLPNERVRLAGHHFSTSSHHEQSDLPAPANDDDDDADDPRYTAASNRALLLAMSSNSTDADQHQMGQTSSYLGKKMMRPKTFQEPLQFHRENDTRPNDGARDPQKRQGHNRASNEEAASEAAVKKWIVDQSNAPKKSRSKFFSNLWKKAMKRSTKARRDENVLAPDHSEPPAQSTEQPSEPHRERELGHETEPTETFHVHIAKKGADEVAETEKIEAKRENSERDVAKYASYHLDTPASRYSDSLDSVPDEDEGSSERDGWKEGTFHFDLFGMGDYSMYSQVLKILREEYLHARKGDEFDYRDEYDDWDDSDSDYDSDEDDSLSIRSYGSARSISVKYPEIPEAHAEAKPIKPLRSASIETTQDGKDVSEKKAGVPTKAPATTQVAVDDQQKSIGAATRAPTIAPTIAPARSTNDSSTKDESKHTKRKAKRKGGKLARMLSKEGPLFRRRTGSVVTTTTATTATSRTSQTGGSMVGPTLSQQQTSMSREDSTVSGSKSCATVTSSKVTSVSLLGYIENKMESEHRTNSENEPLLIPKMSSENEIEVDNTYRKRNGRNAKQVGSSGSADHEEPNKRRPRGVFVYYE